MEEKKRRRIDELIEPGAAISKKSYLFSVRKPYSNVRKFRPTYAGDLNLSGLRFLLSDFLDRRKRGEKPRHLRPFFNPGAIAFSVLKYTLLLFIILILGLLFLSWLSPPGAARNVPVQNFTFSYSYSFLNTEAISFKSDLKAYATVRFNATDTKGGSILMRLYGGSLPRSVVLLNSKQYDADEFGNFRSELKRLLLGAGVEMKEMRMSQLMHAPESKPMFLVVPTGKVPRAFLGLDDPKFDFRKLMDLGNVIVYMGYRFDTEAIGENGALDSVPAGVIAKFGMAYSDLQDIRLTDGFRMDRASYRITGSQLAHGGISVLRGKTGGHLVVFPATLGKGWARGEDAAYDIYSVFREITWLAPSAFADPYFVTSKDRETPIGEALTIFSYPYEMRETLTAQFMINVTSFVGENTTKLEYVSFPLNANGTLSNEDKVIPTGICVKKDADGTLRGCELYMTMDLRESARRTETMAISAYKDGILVSKTPIGPRPTQLIGEKVNYAVELPPGDYVLKIEDQTGYVYAQSFLHVQDVTFKLGSTGPLSYQRGQFFVEALADGSPPKQDLEVKNIYVSLDGQQNKSLNSSKIGGSTYLKYDFSGAIPEGDHKFYVWYDGRAEVLKSNYTPPRAMWDNPLYQALLLIAVVIGAVAIMIKRPESVVFQLDVPDFPPLSKTKVPITREQACQIFELVNSDYRWKNMPLRQGEIKNGFRKISYKGRPILVSDYNLERLLDQLGADGLVKGSMQFYGLSSWEERSGKSMEYLAIFRSLRDSFLNMSVHFSDLGDKTDCDMLVSAHDKYFVHIHQGAQSVGRALSTLSKGKTLLVFRDRDAAEDFRASLSSTNEAMIKVKLYIDKESLFVVTPDDVEKIVKR